LIFIHVCYGARTLPQGFAAESAGAGLRPAPAVFMRLRRIKIVRPEAAYQCNKKAYVQNC